MAKISDLPTVVTPTGDETAVVLRNGAAHRVAISGVVDARLRGDGAAQRVGYRPGESVLDALDLTKPMTIAQREQIPMHRRYNGMTVTVTDIPGGSRIFEWVTVGSPHPITGAAVTETNWAGHYRPREAKRLDIDPAGILPAVHVEGLSKSNAAIDDLATLRIAGLSASTSLASWTIVGPAPTAQRWSWNGYSVTLPGTARTLPFRNYAVVTGIGAVGNSLLDSTDRDTGAAKVARRRGVKYVSAARYNSDGRMEYRIGAAPIHLTVPQGTLSTTSRAVSLINGLPPSNDINANPASFLNTGDRNLVTGVSMTGTVVQNGQSRRAIVSIPNAESVAYAIRLLAGEAALALSGPVLFIPDYARELAGCVVYLNLQNDFSSGQPGPYGDYTNHLALEREDRIIAYLQSIGCAVRLLPVLPSADWTERGPDKPFNIYLACNARRLAKWASLWARSADGKDWIDWLKSKAGVGIPADQVAADLQDVANGSLPRSRRRDALHPNDRAEEDNAEFIEQDLITRELPPTVVEGTQLVLHAESINPRTGKAVWDEQVVTATIGLERAIDEQLEQMRASQAVGAPYRSTVEEGVAKQDSFFLVRTDGVPHLYERTVAAPFYIDRGPLVSKESIGFGAYPADPAQLPLSGPQALAIAAAQPPAPRTVTASTIAVDGDTITADSRNGPLQITAPTDGSPFTVRMPEGLIVGLVTIAGNSRSIDGAATVTSADWGGFALAFRSIGATWVYDAAYIYGSAA